MNDVLLEMRGITKTFPGVKALDNVQLTLRKGRVMALMGENGAGKSTLAKTIFGLLSPNQGQITFKGKSIAGLRPNQIVQRGMCYVPQIKNVFAALTIEENLEAFAPGNNMKHMPYAALIISEFLQTNLKSIDKPANLEKIFNPNFIKTYATQ